MNIYLLVANPDNESFDGQIGEEYANKARAMGHNVIKQNLGDLHFDPVLWKGHKVTQALEPDLLAAQANITWCNKWVIIYPVWWGSVPALLKGFIDRVLYSGFAYRYHSKGPFWDKLLKGKSAHIITTSDAPGFWLLWQYRNSDINAIKRATLNFCGISPVETTRITNVKYLTPDMRIKKIKQLVSSIGNA